ncbi:MAG: hypothetical protein EAX90_09665 [Candidatus Heimdallarchaeota archaeon]|nr:hypothetical protein [Candidatus Heimdallarchaeota archaeon]
MKLKKVEYFKTYGNQNTDTIIEIVKERLAEGDIKTVVVASTTGKTGVKFAENLTGKANVVIVSHKEMNSENKQKIRELKAKPIDKTHLALHTEGIDKIRETYRTFGQGMKVAVEVILIAADLGEIELYRDVIGVGGTNIGADTAIIARATTTKEIFIKDNEKRLEIREILAMPLEKKWW